YLVHFRLPPELREAPERYWLHPALMDNALNVLGQLLGSQLYLPLSVGRLDLFERLPFEFYSHFRGLSKALFEREAIRFDVRLLGVDGSVIADVHDYTVKKVGDPARRIAALVEAEPSLHRLALVALGPSSVDQGSRSGGARVIVTGPQGLGAQLAASSEDDVWVVLSDGYERRGERRFAVDGTAADFSRVWSALVEEQSSVQSVVYVDAGAQQPEDEPGTAVPASLATLVCLVKSLKHAAVERGLSVGIVAEVSASEAPTQMSDARRAGQSAALFAFARCVQAEFPSWTVRCIEAEEGVTSQTLDSELRAAPAPDFVALRSRGRFGLRLESLPAGSTSLDLERPGAWVITGGLGGLGLATAEALVEEGVRHLVLVGRSLPSSELEQYHAPSAKQRY